MDDRVDDEPDVLVQELVRNGDRRRIIAACGALGGACGLVLLLAAYSGAFGDPRRALLAHAVTTWALMLAPLVGGTALGYAVAGVRARLSAR
jgi:hypothetical protein